MTLPLAGPPSQLPRPFLVTRRAEVERSVVEGLKPFGIEVDSASSMPDRLVAGAFLLVDSSEPEFLAAAQASRPGGSGAVILFDGSRPQTLKAVLGASEASCFVGMTESGSVAAGGLVAALERLRGGPADTLSRVMGPSLKVVAWDLASTRAKAEVLDRTTRFCWENRLHPEISASVLTVADELLTNAIFDAPLDEQGAPLYAKLPRGSVVGLPEGRTVRLQLVFDGTRLAVRVRDPWGSLRRRRIVECLSNSVGTGPSGQPGRGGAELGLYYCYSLVHQLLFEIHSGQSTEVFGVFEEVKSYKRYLSLPKSLGVFTRSAENS